MKLQNDDRSQSLSRRGLLQIGGFGLMGLDLAGLFRAKAVQASRSPALTPKPRATSCILIFYYGGPSHLDTFDMKPLAPVEVRGEFQSIATTVPGLRISEHLPQTAKLMHKAALIRSMHHSMRAHDSACIETLTGRTPVGGDQAIIPETPTSYPCHGASISYLRRHEKQVLSHAALPYVMHNIPRTPGQTAGFLGSAYAPFQIDGDPETLTYRADILDLQEGVTSQRLERRKALLGTIDHASGGFTGSVSATSMQASYEKAFDLLGSETVRRALDIEEEDARTRARYGYGPAGQSYRDGGAGPTGAELGIARNMRGLNLLMARRLVEAGVPFVNVYDFKQQGKNWDSHRHNFSQHKDILLPRADQALSALIEDLDERGLLNSTLVIAVGEFGRTPKINKNAGRDHWPDCYSALLFGAGVQGGLVYGASDKIGAYPDQDPVSPGDLAATLFWCFGLNPESEIHDATGRPYRLAEGEPLHGLFGT